MAQQLEPRTLLKLTEMIDELNETVEDIRETSADNPNVPQSIDAEGIRALQLVVNAQTAGINALLKIVGMLADDIDRARIGE